MADHPPRVSIYINGSIVLSRVGQVTKVQQDKGLGFAICWEPKTEERCMVGYSHVYLNSRCHGQCKITRARRHRPGVVARLAQFLGIHTAIDIVILAAHIGENGEVPKRRLTSST